VVSDQHAGKMQAIGLEHVDQIAGRVRGIDDHAVTGLPITDQVGEVAHLRRDPVALGEVAAGKQLAEVQPVGVRHPLSLSGPATRGKPHRLVPLRTRLYPLLGPRRDPNGRSGAAPLAQSVERFHGKEKVNGSIPLGGSVDAEQAGGPERRQSSPEAV
jgi:hypothetical protein